MSHITKEQLTHLAKLARIQLTPEDEAKLLPQLEDIIWFVAQLQELDIDTDDIDDIHTMSLHEWVECAWLTEKLLANVQHPLQDQAIQITGTLSEK